MNTRQLSYTTAKILAIAAVCSLGAGCAVDDGIYYAGSVPGYVTTSTTTVQTSAVGGCGYQNYSYVNSCPSSYYVRTCYPGFACWN